MTGTGKMRAVRHKLLGVSRGAISLFLAILLTPFLTIAILLVDVQRYNGAVSILDEAMGVTSTSVLADYDDYLLNRWGLTAVSQEKDIDGTFSNVLQTNVGVLGDTLTLNKVNAHGVGDSSLANSDVLYHQILEFEKLNAPATLATELLDISELISALEQFKHIDQILSIATGGLTAVNALVSLGEDADKAKASADKLDGYVSTYNSKYGTFKSAVDALIEQCAQLDSLKSEKVSLEQQVSQASEELSPLQSDVKSLQDEIKQLENERNGLDKDSDDFADRKKSLDDSIKQLRESLDDATKAYDDKSSEKNGLNEQVRQKESEIAAKNRSLQSYVDSAVAARDEYASCLSEIAAELDAFCDAIESCEQDIGNLQQGVVNTASSVISYDLEKGKDKLDEEKDELDNLKKGTAEYESKQAEIAKQTAEVAEKSYNKSYASATKNATSTVVDNWNTTMKDYDEATIKELATSFRVLQSEVKAFDVNAVKTTRIGVSDSRYHRLSVSGYVKASEIDAYLEKCNKELFQGSLKSFIQGMVEFIQSLANIKLFYDADLAAVIDTGFYDANVGGLPGGAAAGGGALAVVSDVGDVLSAIKDFGEKISTLRFLGAAKAVRDAIVAVVSFATDLAQFLVDIGTNLAQLRGGYDRWWYSTYSAFNLPCRTDLGTAGSNFKAQTGYSLKDAELPGIDSLDLPVVGDIAALIETLNKLKDGSGGDITFSGAELEYVLFGSNSEIANQLYAFIAVYIIRLVLTIPGLGICTEAQQMIEATGPGAPLAIAAFLALEPLADTLILVNGKEVPLIESQLHLTPSGITDFVSSFTTIPLGDDTKDKMSNGVSNAFGGIKQSESGKTSPVGSYLKGLLSFSYREYCFFALLATVTRDQQLARLANLIQMETLYYYQKKKASYTFDLRRTYTYVSSEADVSVKQILPSLTDSSLFKITRRVQRGY